MSVILPEHFGDTQKDAVKEVLVAHKDFLKQLCDIDNWRKSTALLASASDEALNALALVVYLINTKHIKIDKASSNQLQEKRKINHIIGFLGTLERYNNFHLLSRAERIRQLLKIGSALPIFLRTLFYRSAKTTSTT